MIFICRENQAAQTVFNYKNVIAYSLSKKLKKGFTENGLELSYEKNGFIPDEDIINGVIKGDLKAKTVIKKAIKDLRNPIKAENTKNVIAATMTMHILVNSSKRQNIIVFVLDDDPQTEEEKAREKFLIKYVKAICDEFGVVPITKINKKIRKIFKGKRKNISKKLEKWIRSGKSKQYGPSRTTVRYCRRLITVFALEMNQIGLSNRDPETIGNKERKDLARALANSFTNDNLKRICETTKKKDSYKLCKYLAKKNKLNFKTYEDIREILNNSSDEYRIPKAEFGYPNYDKDKKKLKKMKKKLEKLEKKGKKKHKKAINKLSKKINRFKKKINNTNYNKPLMNVNRFIKKLSKYRLTKILQLIYMNMAYVQLTNEKIGSNEWIKGIQKNLVNTFGKELATAFIAAAKKTVEDKETKKENKSENA